MNGLAVIFRRHLLVAVLACVALFGAGPSTAQQVQTIDPDAAIDGDLGSPAAVLPSVQPSPIPSPRPYLETAAAPSIQPDYVDPAMASSDPSDAATQATENPAAAGTYQRDDLVGAAEGVFGKGSEGLARVIEDILKKQGEPNGYIVGREGGGAFFVGARYGSGTLFHKIEGQKPVYWRGPSLGLDIGGNAAKTFVLVYNLYDTDELFHTYGQGEGQAYLIGGFHVAYLRRKNVVLIPVRVGAGLRLGVNVGYMKFSEKQRWLPF